MILALAQQGLSRISVQLKLHFHDKRLLILKCRLLLRSRSGRKKCQNSEKLVKKDQKPLKTAQKPQKNRQYGGLAVLQISIIYNFHNSPVWWVEMVQYWKTA